MKTANSNRTYLRNRRLLQVDSTQQETKAECFEISWQEPPQSVTSCLRAATLPWQPSKSSCIKTGGKRRSVTFTSEEDQVSVYQQ